MAENDWRTEVKISYDHRVNLDKILNTFLQFQHIWDRRFVRIEAVKHRVKLPSVGERPIHSAFYYAGLRAQEFEQSNWTGCSRWSLTTRPNGTNDTHCVRSQKRWNTPIWRRVPQVERSIRSRLLAHTIYGPVNLFSWWCHHFLDIGR